MLKEQQELFQVMMTEGGTMTQTSPNVGNWESDGTPIILDSRTTRPATPHFSKLSIPEPFKAGLTGIGKGAVTNKGSVGRSVLDERGQV